MAYEVDFMGLRLKNAVVVAAGPWASDGASIQKCIDAGAAAVITETILMEESSYFSPRMHYRDGEMLSLSLYGHKSIEEWEAEVERVHKKDSVLICSIRGASPSEIAYIAKRTERLGADALQLDIFAPMDATIEQINLMPDKLYAGDDSPALQHERHQRLHPRGGARRGFGHQRHRKPARPFRRGS